MYRLHLSKKQGDEIKVSSFSNSLDLALYLETIFVRKAYQKLDVWLFSFDDEIIVTQNKEMILELINNNVRGDLYLFVYNSFEEAYKTALDMRETNEKCYKN